MVPRSGAVPGVTPWSTTEGTYRDGLLALRPKRTLAAGVSPHGGGPDGSGLRAQSGGKAQLEAEAPPLPQFTPVGDFPLEQLRDDTLRSAVDQNSVEHHKLLF
ncbi:hypothetical protein NHX12_008962 [Muraenolepis orangiensis]|uniref:Uncharacterized protein n=1 Tax=Muraenolepis orangiensis TaxID=630683 RepID=A0A9Q0DLS1_9TELE|nr:hypothetical protein NHX12_008962 [Muraenolepis orangiensis]